MSVVVMEAAELAALIKQSVAEALSQAQRPAVPGEPAGPRWLTTPQAAARLGIDRSTVRAWLIEGTIPRHATIRSGRVTRVAAWWVEGQQR